MKLMYVEAKAMIEFKLTSNQIKQLPTKIGVATTIQFLDKIEKIKQHLEKNNKKVTLLKGIHSKHKGQILGCDLIDNKLKHDVDGYLFIGDGMFHPIALSLNTKKTVFAYNPFNKKLTKVDKTLVEKLEKRKTAALVKYLSSQNIGVLVSTKYGQQDLKSALSLKKKLKYKNTYIFLCNTLDFNELEDFPFIECWVNTMCPRIAYDDSIKIRKPIINIEDIK